MMMKNNESIKNIDLKLKEARLNSEAHTKLLKQHAKDLRKGVIKLIEREEKYLVQQQKLQERLELLLKEEKEYQKRGYKYIAGADEAGRGPLAGPVVAAAVMLPLDFKYNHLLNDSKRINEHTRNLLYENIINDAIDVKVAMVTPTEIDEINILQASLLSMANAVVKLRPIPQIVLVDGHMKIPSLKVPQRAIIKGDAKVRVIAAASIVAKVYRDRLMNHLDKHYPEYELITHKGYPTALHRVKLRMFGESDIHRKSFKWNKYEL